MPNPGIAPVDREVAPTRDHTDAHATLRILLTAHYELTEMAGDAGQELRSLLLRGNGRDRNLSRGGLPLNVLWYLARRQPPPEATDNRLARDAEIQRLATVLMAYRDELAANREHMATLVNDLVPGITAEPGMGPFKAAKAILDTGPFALDQYRITEVAARRR